MLRKPLSEQWNLSVNSKTDELKTQLCFLANAQFRPQWYHTKGTLWMVMVKLVVVIGGVIITILLQKKHLPCDEFQQNGKNVRLAVMENLGTNLASAHEWTFSSLQNRGHHRGQGQNGNQHQDGLSVSPIHRTSGDTRDVVTVLVTATRLESRMGDSTILICLHREADSTGRVTDSCKSCILLWPKLYFSQEERSILGCSPIISELIKIKE